MGLASRDYMRDSEVPPNPRFAWQLPLMLVGLWFVVGVWENRPILEWTVLAKREVLQGQIWRLFSYGLIHVQFAHVFFNCLGIYMFGRTIAQLHGDRFAWQAWAWGVLSGGLAWFFLQLGFGFDDVAIGASAGVSCLVTGWCLHYYTTRVTIVVYVIPINMTGRNWLIAFFSLDFILMIIFEMGSGKGDGIAHSAHLGGFLAALAVFAPKLDPWEAARIPVLRPFLALREVRQKRRHSATPRRSGPIPPSENRLDTPYGTPSQAEVDRILDKINEHGFGSLTPEEKATLDRVSRRS